MFLRRQNPTPIVGEVLGWLAHRLSTTAEMSSCGAFVLENPVPGSVLDSFLAPVFVAPVVPDCATVALVAGLNMMGSTMPVILIPSNG